MVLFHATYRARLQSIKQYGLGAKKIKNWNISSDKLTYFAFDPHVAESYCEIAEDVSPDVYESGIILLAVESMRLDQNLFVEDNNQMGDGSDTVAYLGLINFDLLDVLEEW